jgi:hypothetical protein
MDQLKQLLRLHYEKIILVSVLLLMGVAAWFIYKTSQEERENIKKIPVGIERRAVKGVKPIDLGPMEKAIQNATNPPNVSLSGNHNLFNPVLWIQYPGKPITKVQTGQEVGPSKLQITEIRPLTLTIAYDRTASSGTGDQKVVTGYYVGVTNDLAVASKRRMMQFSAVGDTNKQVFVLTEAKGSPDAPTEFVARLKDFGNESISFTTNKPYVRVVGYEADLKYTLTGATNLKQRKDMNITVEDVAYKIVDITESNVVLSDSSNGKRYTIGLTTTP